MSVNQKEIVKEINAAFSNNDIDAFLNHCADDVIWYMSGPLYHGKEAVRQVFTGMPAPEGMQISIDRMIEEGNLVTAEGSFTMNRQEGGLYEAVYCDVYRFEIGRIKELRSYVVEKK